MAKLANENRPFPQKEEGKSRTYYTKRPKEAVVANHPRLFRKPRLVFGRGDSPTSSQWPQNAIHEAIAKSSKEHQIVSHVINVIEANRVLSSRGVIVGQPQERPRKGPSSGNQQLGEVEKKYEIENDSYNHVSMDIQSPIDELMRNGGSIPA